MEKSLRLQGTSRAKQISEPCVKSGRRKKRCWVTAVRLHVSQYATGFLQDEVDIFRNLDASLFLLKNNFSPSSKQHHKITEPEKALMSWMRRGVWEGRLWGDFTVMILQSLWGWLPVLELKICPVHWNLLTGGEEIVYKDLPLDSSAVTQILWDFWTVGLKNPWHVLLLRQRTYLLLRSRWNQC